MKQDSFDIGIEQFECGEGWSDGVKRGNGWVSWGNKYEDGNGWGRGDGNENGDGNGNGWGRGNGNGIGSQED